VRDTSEIREGYVRDTSEIRKGYVRSLKYKLVIHIVFSLPT
jgi:hypothetical protein